MNCFPYIIVIEQLLSTGSNPFFYFDLSLIMLMSYVLLGTHTCFNNTFKNEVACFLSVYTGKRKLFVAIFRYYVSNVPIVIALYKIVITKNIQSLVLTYVYSVSVYFKINFPKVFSPLNVAFGIVGFFILYTYSL